MKTIVDFMSSHMWIAYGLAALEVLFFVGFFVYVIIRSTRYSKKVKAFRSNVKVGDTISIPFGRNGFYKNCTVSEINGDDCKLTIIAKLGDVHLPIDVK